MSFLTRIPAKAATVLGTALALACSGTAATAADNGGAAFDETAAAAPEARHALLGKPLHFKGSAQPGARIAVQRLDDGAWVTEATAVAGDAGRYHARWRAEHIGVFQLRAVPAGNGNVRASAVEEPVRVTVYKPAGATWYGRGWYGRKTACGQTLSPTLMGVAHKTLPCGTKVSFLYKGKSITVPVIDRGPYGAGLSWDLTTAAADELGFLAAGRVTLGAVSLRRR